MTDSLKDIKLIISILGILNTLVVTLVFQWWRNRKSLSCEIVSDIHWYNVQPDIEDRVQVLLDGKPAKNANLVKLKVVNNGRVPIDEKDFIIPFSVSFGKDSEIITADITETSPSDLPARIVPEKQRITVEPLVLNWGDAITIRILVITLNDSIEVAGRVKGIRQLKKRWSSSDDPRYYFGGLLLIGLIISWVLAAVPIQIVINRVISLQQLGVFRYILSLVLAFLLISVPPYLLRITAQKDLKKQRKRHAIKKSLGASGAT
jgi:hypothetical protein